MHGPPGHNGPPHPHHHHHHSDAELAALRTGDTLLVTALFPVSSSRHLAAHDQTRLTALLSSVASDIVLYTPDFLAPLVSTLRPASLLLHVNTSFAALTALPPFERIGADVLQDATSRAAVELAKPYFVSAAAHQFRAKGYKYVLWVDPDAFATGHAYHKWPDADRLEETLAKTKAGDAVEGLLMSVHYAPSTHFMVWKPMDGPLSGMMAETSLFGGSRTSVEWYARAFYAYLDYWKERGELSRTGRDVHNALLFLYSNRFATVWPADYNAPGARLSASALESALGYCGDQQFYAQFFLASESEKRHMNFAWQDEWHLMFWRSRRPCRDTRAQDATSMLTSMFSDWKPPLGFLQIPQTTWV
ncbi:hypothetical protein BKA62DRAFT_681774 [Auriculariales sp. MPI-PUGE-AT-0066]|nr:hypothetical protein BKA62DRAFT_681774 [Auriculariales sp. MPI-PUGE-AT-0066]